MKAAIPARAGSRPGRTEFDAITLERGVTADREFEKWANQVWFFQAQAPGESALGNFRRDITIELRNEAGQPVLRYFVLSLLGVGVPGDARSRRERQRDRDRAHQDRERRVAPRSRR